jgi:hypothetical protein
MARKNLKVPEDLFMALRDDKDDQQSWPHYLEEQCLHDTQRDADEVAKAFVRAFPYDEQAERTAMKTADELEARKR